MSWTSTATASTTPPPSVISSIKLSSIPSTCFNGTISITLVNSSNAAIGTVAPTAIGTSSTQDFTSIAGSPVSTAVTGAYISIVGP